MNRILLSTALCALALPASASAFSGTNGPILFDRGGSVLAGESVLSATGYDHGAASSPDGTQVAYNVNRDIWIMNADGSGKRRLTTDGEFNADPAWSPDGRQIAYASGLHGRPELYSIPVAGGTPKRLTFTDDHEETLPAWSPDGTRIAYQRTGCEVPYGGGHCVYVMPATGGPGVNLTPEDEVPGCEKAPGFYFSGASREPAWSPDGRRIAFNGPLNCKVSVVGTDIWVMNADGSGKTNLIGDDGTNDQQPSWSPDGAQIAFMSNREGSVPRIFRMGSGGGGIVAASTGSNDRKPDWAPAPKVCRVPRKVASLKVMGCRLDKVVRKRKQATRPGTVLKAGAKVKVFVPRKK